MASSSQDQGPPSYEHLYTSASVNRSTHLADWSTVNGLPILAFATHKSIAISITRHRAGSLDHHERHPTSLIQQLIPTPFTKPITSLKFSQPDPSRQPAIIAGSADGRVGIWRQLSPGQWSNTCNLGPPHSGSVSTLAVLRSQSRASSAVPSDEIVATGASDGLLRVWSIQIHDQHDTAQLIQTIDLKGSFPLDAALSIIPGAESSDGRSKVLMALATTTKLISIWCLEVDREGGFAFAHKLSLEGHEDWVRSLDICAPKVEGVDRFDGAALMLASGSQDGSVRLWRIGEHRVQPAGDRGASPSAPNPGKQADEFEQMVSKIERDLSQHKGEISNRAHVFDVQGRPWAVTFDALLVGHDSWVTGVRWHPGVGKDGQMQPAALLSSSADNSLILWTPTGTSPGDQSPFPFFSAGLVSGTGSSRGSAASSVWLSSQRFGEVGGSSNLGFFGALWRPPLDDANDDDYEAVLAHGWGGSTHVWSLSKGGTTWSPTSPITGHHAPAKSVAWEKNGDYFLSAGLDRTTRLHGLYRRRIASPGGHSKVASWHELARPQSHGYDISSVSWLDRLSFASAADEKVVRVFAAPKGFVESSGTQGLDCANLAAGSKVASVRRSVLAFRIADRNGLAAPGHLSGPIKEATKRAGEQLLIVVSSPLFSSPSGPLASFKEIENFLKWTYAQAWSEAIKEDRLLMDISVLLTPEEKGESICVEFSKGCEAFFVVDEASSRLSFTLGFPVEELAASVPSTQSPQPSDLVPFPQYRNVALGGTFDHLHVGHKILIGTAALVATERIIVGVTDDKMLTNKNHASLLESLEDRIDTVERFIRLVRTPFSPVKQEVVQLSDVCGPAGTEEDLQVLVVTDETIAGGEFIAKTRSEAGLPKLENLTIGVIGAAGETDLQGDAKALAASKVGSTAIREWLSRKGPRFLAAVERRKRTLAKDPKASETAEERPVGASVPPLGLSNRAVFEGQTVEEKPSETGQPLGPAKESVSSILIQPPTEEQLAVSTLWPELDKLYGHGYELLCLSASPNDGRFVASSCKSTSEEHAVVRIHDRAQGWKEVGKLEGHSLSVTRIRWSMDSSLILTASRDRSWRLFGKVEQQPGGDGDANMDPVFVPLTGERAHSRILWDCAFSDDADEKHTFATASRDKTVKIWKLLDEEQRSSQGSKPHLLLSTLRFQEAVTAVTLGCGRLLAVGLENGQVQIFRAGITKGDRGGEMTEWDHVITLDKLHSEAVNELSFRPPRVEDGENATLLSAGEDGAVRLFKILL
ncbi:WD40 repeat-like protein [Violaceomyces palustris]|uniref:WD40 repeat-like protein n=1 Tax=Violaceomyces palustris TaxID=1673888 RepID=A0ACD0P3G4_9BASI|nr:WD40 repeat-like protein [Violaceomyces palustris]